MLARLIMALVWMLKLNTQVWFPIVQCFRCMISKVTLWEAGNWMMKPWMTPSDGLKHPLRSWITWMALKRTPSHGKHLRSWNIDIFLHTRSAYRAHFSDSDIVSNACNVLFKDSARKWCCTKERDKKTHTTHQKKPANKSACLSRSCRCSLNKILYFIVFEATSVLTRSS